MKTQKLPVTSTQQQQNNKLMKNCGNATHKHKKVYQ